MPSLDMDSGVTTGNSINDAELVSRDSVPQVHSIDAAMSAPSINIAGDLMNEVSGNGLALADVPVEQDRAYWEWRVNMRIPSSNAVSSTIMFGVSNKRNSKFYEILAESTVPASKHGTKFMCSVSNLKDGDVVGVLIQQSEIPMIQLYLNGKLHDGGQISKFRGTVFPSVYLPPGSTTATFLYATDHFVHGPPRPGFEPLMAERSLM
ncbi:hypothetical protein ACHAXA_004340 [Cyclostephanos tholiformis]|uniref:SPRY domain-containing protein n=1 Tax=Cyclostephanos tholiformis TaxID=382380 RepID=A0ABD3SQD2_9STRA